MTTQTKLSTVAVPKPAPKNIASKHYLALLCSSFLSPLAWADDACLLEQMKTQAANKTLGEIRDFCEIKPARQTPSDDLQAKHQEESNTVASVEKAAELESFKTSANGEEPQQEDLAITNRRERERANAFDPYVIIPHRMNYILPISYMDDINEEAYVGTKFEGENKKQEAKFQISFKVPVNYDDIFFEDDGLFFGFTLKSWWQVYADNISRPFRETNYRPELFYVAPTSWEPMGGRTWLAFGIEHQSNGQSQELSRSWNRLYTSFLYEQENLAIALQPWWRLPEDDKSDPDDSDGDDNPDIEHYMGHFELTAAYQWRDYEFSFLGRQNFKYHKGYAELGFTFPLYGRLRGFVQYTTGYGESLIDYNNSQNRIGVGIALTDML